MIVLALPSGSAISLESPDVRRLIELLWNVSARPGAVVAIGRLNHSLAQLPTPVRVELTPRETTAVQAGLEAEHALPRGLQALHKVLIMTAGH
jgi:hypothetical protein